MCQKELLMYKLSRIFHSQALTNLKTLDAFSMRTLGRMTKMENTSLVNRWR